MLSLLSVWVLLTAVRHWSLLTGCAILHQVLLRLLTVHHWLLTRSSVVLIANDQTFRVMLMLLLLLIVLPWVALAVHELLLLPLVVRVAHGSDSGETNLGFAITLSHHAFTLDGLVRLLSLHTNSAWISRMLLVLLLGLVVVLGDNGGRLSIEASVIVVVVVGVVVAVLLLLSREGESYGCSDVVVVHRGGQLLVQLTLLMVRQTAIAVATTDTLLVRVARVQGTLRLDGAVFLVVQGCSSSGRRIARVRLWVRRRSRK